MIYPSKKEKLITSLRSSLKSTIARSQLIDSPKNIAPKNLISPTESAPIPIADKLKNPIPPTESAPIPIAKTYKLKNPIAPSPKSWIPPAKKSWSPPTTKSWITTVSKNPAIKQVSATDTESISINPASNVPMQMPSDRGRPAKKPSKPYSNSNTLPSVPPVNTSQYVLPKNIGSPPKPFEQNSNVPMQMPWDRGRPAKKPSKMRNKLTTGKQQITPNTGPIQQVTSSISILLGKFSNSRLPKFETL